MTTIEQLHIGMRVRVVSPNCREDWPGIYFVRGIGYWGAGLENIAISEGEDDIGSFDGFESKSLELVDADPHEAQVASFTKDVEFWKRKTAEAQTELSTAREDGRRLDWLQETETSVGYNVENGMWGVNYESPYADTVRAVITQAMTGGAE